MQVERHLFYPTDVEEGLEGNVVETWVVEVRDVEDRTTGGVWVDHADAGGELGVLGL